MGASDIQVLHRRAGQTRQGLKSPGPCRFFFIVLLSPFISLFFPTKATIYNVYNGHSILFPPGLHNLQRTLHLIFFQYDILLAYQAFQILGSQHYLKLTITTTTDTPLSFSSPFSPPLPRVSPLFPPPHQSGKSPAPLSLALHLFTPSLPSLLSLFSPFHLSFFPFQIPSFCCRSSFCQLSRSYRFAANLSPSLSLWS